MRKSASAVLHQVPGIIIDKNEYLVLGRWNYEHQMSKVGVAFAKHKGRLNGLDGQAGGRQAALRTSHQPRTAHTTARTRGQPGQKSGRYAQPQQFRVYYSYAKKALQHTRVRCCSSSQLLIVARLSAAPSVLCCLGHRIVCAVPPPPTELK